MIRRDFTESVKRRLGRDCVASVRSARHDETGKLSRFYKDHPPTDATQWRPYLKDN